MFSDRLVEWLELDHDVPNNVERVAEAPTGGWAGTGGANQCEQRAGQSVVSAGAWPSVREL